MLCSRPRPRPIRALIALLLAQALAASPAPAATQPAPALPPVLDLPTALALFHDRGYDLLLADLAVVAAEGDVRSARALPNPGVAGSFGKSFGCVSGHCAWLGAPAWSVSLNDSGLLATLIAGKVALRSDVARAALKVTQLSRDDARRTLVPQVKQQFVAVLLAQETLQLAQETQSTSAELLSLTQVRYRAGAISEADVARAETDKLETDQAVDTAAGDLRSAQVALAFLLGVRGEVPAFEVRDERLLNAVRPTWLTDERPEALLERAYALRPDLKAQRAEVDRAQAGLRLAKRERFPDISLGLSYAQQGTTPDAVTPPTFAVDLATTLPLYYQQQGEIQRAQADLRAQEVTRQKAESQVAADVAQGLASFRTTEALVRRMEGGLLARAERARDLVQVQYSKGAASLLELLDAQRTYRQVAFEHLQDITNYWSAVFKLEEAVGVENP